MGLTDCLCIRHILFEDLGTYERALVNAGLTIDIRNVGVDAIPDQMVQDADLVVVLGAPLGVSDTESHPYLKDEIGWIQRRLYAARPTLGVCLGAQIMAVALGSEVRPGPEKEIEWKEVTVNEQIPNNLLLPLKNLPVFHWHGDNIALPQQAVCLASTEVCPVQSFSVENFGLGLQFHLEFEPKKLEHWLVGHWVELQHAGVDPAVLRWDTERFGKRLTQVAPAVLTSWLERL